MNKLVRKGLLALGLVGTLAFNQPSPIPIKTKPLTSLEEKFKINLTDQNLFDKYFVHKVNHLEYNDRVIEFEIPEKIKNLSEEQRWNYIINDFIPTVNHLQADEKKISLEIVIDTINEIEGLEPKIDYYLDLLEHFKEKGKILLVENSRYFDDTGNFIKLDLNKKPESLKSFEDNNNDIELENFDKSSKILKCFNEKPVRAVNITTGDIKEIHNEVFEDPDIINNYGCGCPLNYTYVLFNSNNSSCDGIRLSNEPIAFWANNTAYLNLNIVDDTTRRFINNEIYDPRNIKKIQEILLRESIENASDFYEVGRQMAIETIVKHHEPVHNFTTDEEIANENNFKYCPEKYRPYLDILIPK
ncbi:MAG: hypothetical protein PHF86_05505 [Candidatus Nanoarchaeia archaeon]|nr:hypothetical protein [Candidatus Nanoarchaeia archaeon]